MSRKKLLFLAQRLPFPPNKGDKIRSFNFLKRMARDYDLYVATFIDDPEDWQNVEGLKPYCKELNVQKLSPRLGKILSLRGLLTGEPLTLPYFRSSALQDWVDKILETEKPDIAFIFSSSMAQYVIDHPKKPGRIVSDFVDIDSDKWQQYADSESGAVKAIYSREAKKLLSYERRASSASDAVTFVSEKEAELYRSLDPHNADKVHGVENGIDCEFFSPEHDLEKVYVNGTPVITMTGAMDYKPNVDGAVWFAQEILPKLRQDQPELQFYVVGSSPTPQVQALADLDGVNVTGRVADVRPYIAQASAIVAPIHIARGIQNKVLEGMAMARPVVATPQAFEGIEAQTADEIIVAEGIEEFTKAVLATLKDTGAAEIGRKARKRVASDYSWESKYDKLKGFLG